MVSGREAQVTRGAGLLEPVPQADRTRPRPQRRRHDWTLAVPPAATLAIMLWGITTPSYWRDESATLSATDRSLPQLLRMLGHVDAVHGLYYLLLWPVVHFAGTREFDTRLPSAVAMAAAALGIAVIGQRVRSRRAGLYAGLVFAAMPLVTLQGHDARPYALETAAAVLATCLLLRAAERPTRSRLAAYGLSLVALGYLHLFGLLIVLAHGLALNPAARLARARGAADRYARGGGPGPRPAGPGPEGAGPAPRPAGAEPEAAGLMLRWLVTVAAAGVLTAPLIWLGWQQRWAIGWLSPPTGHDLSVLAASFAAGTLASVPVFAAFAALGAVRTDWPGQRSRLGRWRPGGAGARGAAAAQPPWARQPERAGQPEAAGQPERALTWLALPWLVLPPAALLIAAEFEPVYQLMYLEYCLPAVALLVGAGLAALGWPLRIAALGLVVALGLPAQHALREPLAGGFIRATAQFLARHERPGDAVYYPSPGGGVPTWGITYPDGFAGLRDIQLGQTAAQAGSLAGTSLPLPVIEQRLNGVRRLWLVEMGSTWLDPPFRLGPDFRLALSWQRNQMRVRLYVRVRPSPATAAA